MVLKRSLATASALCAVLLAAALSSAAASGQSRRLLQEEHDTTAPNIAAAAAAASARASSPPEVSQPSRGATFELPNGVDPMQYAYKFAMRTAAIKGASGADAAVTNSRRRSPRPSAAANAPGTPAAHPAAAAAAAVITEALVGAASSAASIAATSATDGQRAAAGDVTPAAWCPNPTSTYASTAANYSACVVLARQSSGARVPYCTAFFVTSPGSRNNIALTAGHCVSDTKGTYILDVNNYGGVDKESIICCAYDRAADINMGSKGYCPPAASFKILSYKLYDSFHKGGRASHDMAVVSTANSPTGRIPGKWTVNNWDPDSGKRNWFVHGYPQYDTRFTTCQRDFNGRRWSYGVNAPVITQPSGQAAQLYGNSCGGLSGAPVVDGRRRTVTGVQVAAGFDCDSSGWGRIFTTAIRAYPGGASGLSDAWSGVDVYSLWQGF